MYTSQVRDNMTMSVALYIYRKRNIENNQTPRNTGDDKDDDSEEANATLVRIMMIVPLARSLMSTPTYISDDPECQRKNSSEITRFVGQVYYLSGADYLFRKSTLSVSELFLRCNDLEAIPSFVFIHHLSVTVPPFPSQ